MFADYHVHTEFGDDMQKRYNTVLHRKGATSCRFFYAIMNRGFKYEDGYLEALSTYTRRRMTQAEKAQVDEVLYVPAALALRQRPGVPGIRSTFGTGTELFITRNGKKSGQ